MHLRIEPLLKTHQTNRGKTYYRLAVCNLYSIISRQAAIRELARAIRDLTGNLPLLPAVYPNRLAPVVRTAADGMRELTMMRRQA